MLSPVCKGNHIIDGKGRRLLVDKLNEGMAISAYPTGLESMIVINIDELYFHKLDKSYIVFTQGKSVIVTNDSYFYTPNGFRSVRQLEIHDELFLVHENNIYKSKILHIGEHDRLGSYIFSTTKEGNVVINDFLMAVGL